jgi:hypothetical protein
MFAVIDRRTEETVKTYKTYKGAALAMRLRNKQAGFARRMTRCWTMGLVLEWCRTMNDEYEYGPYAVGGQIHHVG